jgi:hypothetical protein
MGTLTIVLIVGLGRTRLKNFSMILAEARLTASTRQAWSAAQEWIGREAKETRDE